MSVIVVDNKQVIQCQHCQGSTICKHAIWTFSDDGKSAFFRCSMCGDGVVRKAGFFGSRFEAAYPVCRVCMGKGYTVP